MPPSPQACSGYTSMTVLFGLVIHLSFRLPPWVSSCGDINCHSYSSCIYKQFVGWMDTLIWVWQLFCWLCISGVRCISVDLWSIFRKECTTESWAEGVWGDRWRQVPARSRMPWGGLMRWYTCSRRAWRRWSGESQSMLTERERVFYILIEVMFFLTVLFTENWWWIYCVLLSFLGVNKSVNVLM